MQDFAPFIPEVLEALGGHIFFILAEVWILVSWITVYLIHFL
jgi:hypothetical protein